MCSDLGDKDTVKVVSIPSYSVWFKSFRWLEYSVRQNAAFYFPCSVFAKNLRKDALVDDGINTKQVSKTQNNTIT